MESEIDAVFSLDLFCLERDVLLAALVALDSFSASRVAQHQLGVGMSTDLADRSVEWRDEILAAVIWRGVSPVAGESTVLLHLSDHATGELTAASRIGGR